MWGNYVRRSKDPRISYLWSVMFEGMILDTSSGVAPMAPIGKVKKWDDPDFRDHPACRGCHASSTVWMSCHLVWWSPKLCPGRLQHGAKWCMDPRNVDDCSVSGFRLVSTSEPYRFWVWLFGWWTDNLWFCTFCTSFPEEKRLRCSDCAHLQQIWK